MFQLTIDTRSQLQVNIPETEDHPGLINLGEGFLDYDQTLPPDMQSPVAAYLATLLEECRPHRAEFHSSEAQRTIASESLKRYEEKAYKYLKRIQQMLKNFFWDTPEQAEAWGFEVKQSTGNIIFPGNRKERLRVLNTYIAKEETRPEEDRFAPPALAEVIEVRDQWVSTQKTRKSSEAQRTTSRAARDATFQRLKEALRLAACHIIVLHYNHTITLDLKRWGFDVTKRSAKATETEAEITPAAAPASEAAPTNGVNGSVELNGSTEVVVENMIP